MKPARFALLIADSLDEALACLKEHGEEARVLAGGQSLMAMLNMRLVTPQVLVDISRLSELATIRSDNGWLEIGATTTQSELLAWPDLHDSAPLLAAVLPHVGHFQTRNRGTVCGSLCHADPSSELPLALAVLGGEVVLRGSRGRRVLPAEAFQTGMLTTARRADEIVVAARFPLRRPATGYAFREIARRHGDFAVAALAAVASNGALRLGVGGLADKPAVRDLSGLKGIDLDEALNAFAWELHGSDDIHASARYRREMVRRVGRQVIEEANNAVAR